ncbi:MAG: GGDEF domain-containing protein [Elusimicrobia bacterium]|nr:GGDEF domain-containing protein [Elusimicrobiota bacterium]
MKFDLACALLSLLPAGALLLSYPRRQWAAAGGLGAAAAAALLLVSAAGPQGRVAASLCAGWGILGGAYALLLCRRSRAERAGQLEALEQTRRRREAAALQVAQVKAAGLRTEREQKETLALYGMIKGFAEALSWEEMRPKLELAVGQFLGVSDFALYVASDTGGFQRLSVRNLDNSPGGSWTTWERYVQEHAVPLTECRILESPERALAVPIHEGAELVGYFYARLPSDQEPEALLAKARTFAAETSLAFRRVKLFQEMERLSQVDGLTGVHRRGAFDEKIREETVRAGTFRTTYSLLMLDIDHFKGLNDRYGHPFGDQVLRRVGQVLNASVYETDFVARYGGEEFVVLMPRAQPEGVMRKAESIRRALAAETFAIAFETISITVSIGVAHFPRDAATPEELVARADGALYQAKSQGRDRVVRYSGGSAPQG